MTDESKFVDAIERRPGLRRWFIGGFLLVFLGMLGIGFAVRKFKRSSRFTTTISGPDFIEAHKHSSNHRDELMRSESCVCFYCLKMFPPSKIEEWVDEETTALCPYCGIDSVIGSASGYPLEPELIRKMHQHWF